MSGGDPAIYTKDFTRGLPGVSSLPSISSIWVYVYWLVGLVFISLVSYVMYSPLNRQVAGTIFWILGFLLVYFYYVKLFLMNRKSRELSTQVSPCPDYLTQYIVPGSADGSTASKGMCLDFVGVSNNGRLKRCDKDASVCLLDPAYTFEAYKKGDTVAELRDRAAVKGLIWSSLLGDV